MIDTHAHLYYSKKFEGGSIGVIERSLSNGVSKILMPNVDRSSIEDMLCLEKNYPNQCYAMMGLHPCYVKENYKDELKLISSWFEKRDFIAVGEIGLDFYWDRTFEKLQYEAFEYQLQLARKYNIPVAIHMRDSIDETLELLENYKDITGVLHCFSGNLSQAQKAIDLGFLLGIGGVLTFKNSQLIEVVKNISLETLLLETDAPYLAPVPKRGKVNEPHFIKYIVEKISEIKGVTEDEIIHQTNKNTLKLFKI